MATIDINTVKAENQLGGKPKVAFECEYGKGKRVLFVGNSITRHRPKSEIGWFNDWGMAASSKDKDYVHLVKKMVLDKDPDAAFCICQAAEWEQNYKTGEAYHYMFSEARDFNADIIVLRIIENCLIRTFDGEIFDKEYRKFLQYLNKDNKAKVIITTSFWDHPGDEKLKNIADDFKYDYIYLGDLGEDETMRAYGLFENSGVAGHPGDKGMEHIATRIFEKLKKYL